MVSQGGGEATKLVIAKDLLPALRSSGLAAAHLTAELQWQAIMGRGSA